MLKIGREDKTCFYVINLKYAIWGSSYFWIYRYSVQHHLFDLSNVWPEHFPQWTVRFLLGDNAKSFSKQPEEVLDEETGATSSSITVSEDECVLSVTLSY